MPLRSFGCEDCEFEWDELVPMNGTAETCPNCGKTNIKTMITSAPVVRKPEYEWSSHDLNCIKSFLLHICKVILSDYSYSIIFT